MCLLLLVTAAGKAWMSGAPGSLVHVMLVSSIVENYSVLPNWNTTWMHVLIRSLRGFSKRLSSSVCESCADSLTCHHKPRALLRANWQESKFALFFRANHCQIYWNVLIYIVNGEGQFPLKYLCCILAAVASQSTVASRWGYPHSFLTSL